MAGLSLEIVEGPGRGRTAPLRRSIDIGRDPTAGLVVDDQLVSRRHARIAPRGDGAVVEDLGSLNGTFVNDEEIQSPTHLRPGDQILVGVSVLELRSAAQVKARPTAVRAKPPALAARERTPDYVPAEVFEGDGARGARPRDGHALDPLLDVRVRAKARTAPLALFVLVALAILIFVAVR